MINGSDDIASADYIYNGFKQVEVAISDQNFIVMPYYWHAYDSSSKKLYYLSYKSSQKIPLGAGRIFPLRFLECINWNNATEKLGYTDYLSVNIISKEWQQYSPYSPL